MKLRVAFDESGRIIGAAEITEEGGDDIEARPGQQVGEFEVPSRFAGGSLSEFAHRLRVDTSRGELAEQG